MRSKTLRFRFFLMAIAVAVVAPLNGFAQGRSLSQGSYRIEITLERNERGAWRSIDSRLILDQDDRVRFRVRTNFSGFLYVTNQSTSGKYDVLFPATDAGRDNKIEAGKEFVVPATQGSFRITGPPGQEIVYWVVSPVELTSPGARPASRPDTPKPGSPPRLIPRCDDTIMRARGNCVDTSAGAKEVGAADDLPADLARLHDLKSRDLVFIRDESSSIVSSSVPLSGPVIYEFRLAHR